MAYFKKKIKKKEKYGFTKGGAVKMSKGTVTRLGKGKYHYVGPGDSGGVYSRRELFSFLKKTRKTQKRWGLPFKITFKW